MISDPPLLGLFATEKLSYNSDRNFNCFTFLCLKIKKYLGNLLVVSNFLEKKSLKKKKKKFEKKR